jgi:hypothetical protein
VCVCVTCNGLMSCLLPTPLLTHVLQHLRSSSRVFVLFPLFFLSGEKCVLHLESVCACVSILVSRTGQLFTVDPTVKISGGVCGGQRTTSTEVVRNQTVTDILLAGS